MERGGDFGDRLHAGDETHRRRESHEEIDAKQEREPKERSVRSPLSCDICSTC